MKSLAFVVSVSAIAVACTLPAAAPPSPLATSAPTVTASAAPAATATAAATAPPSSSPVPYRLLTNVPGNAIASPDGRWIVAQRTTTLESPLLLFNAQGVLVRELAAIGGGWSWLHDSSGVFAAVDFPQRAPGMHIAELDGRLVSTELQLSHETLSPDGKLIAAQHQEGCCVAVTQREIRVARRDGSGTRTLVTSASDDAQPVALLGIDASGRLVYRDGPRIMRVSLAGGVATSLATSPDFARVVSGGTSPDGLVVMARAYDPARWYAVSGDDVRSLDGTIGVVIEDWIRVKEQEALWVGPHTFLARDDTGAVFRIDPVTSTRTRTSARLLNIDFVLAHQRGWLLLVRGREVTLLDLGTGTVRHSGLDLNLDAEGARATALPGGGFIVSTSSATYRID